MRTLLVLHNGQKLNPFTDGCIIDFYEKYPGNKDVIYNVADLPQSLLYRLLCKCDDIAFQTDFENVCHVETLVNMISRIKTKSINVFVYYVGLRDKLKQLYSIDELNAIIQRHNIFELYEHATSKFEISLVEDLKYFQQEEQQYLESVELRRNNFTGRQIKILSIFNRNIEYSNLNDGDIVNELNCDDIDSNLQEGVWVWGNTHPVKLINYSHNKEYEILETSNEDALINIIKLFAGSNFDQTKVFVNKILKSKLDSSIKANLIAAFVGINDDANRAYLEIIIKQH